MGKRTVRRPTEDQALTRVTAWEKTQPACVSVCDHKRTIMDVDGTMYITWFYHTKLSLKVATLWGQWLRDWKTVPTFVEFLNLFGVIYKSQRVSQGGG